MNAFLTTCELERRKGYLPNLRLLPNGNWECRLDCNLDVLPSSVERPQGVSASPMAALVVAVRNRDRLLQAVA